MNLLEVSEELARRLSRLFIRDKSGHRPSHGRHGRWNDEHWRDHVLFYEYFHGDKGAGLGASHQKGWTGLGAPLIEFFNRIDAKAYLEAGTRIAEQALKDQDERAHI